MIMSKLEELIKKLCPDGVEYKSLQEILTIKNGSDYKGFKKGEIPVYGSGGIMTYVDTFAFDKPSVLIPRKGSIDKLYYVDTPFWNVDTIFYTDIDTTKAIPRYVYHCLLREHLEQYNTAGGVPSLTQKVLNKIQIPVPPLPVQQEIIRILDNFTELTAELTAELTLRKKQYEHYRDTLLSFDDIRLTDQMNNGGGYNYRVKLGKIGKVCMCKRILKNQTSTTGDIPFYKIGTFGKTADAFISRALFEDYKTNFPFPKKGAILISAAGTIGRSVIYDGKPAYYQDSNIVWIDNDESIALNKWLFYCYQMSPWHISTGGTIARLYNDNIANAEIPLPPLDMQERITSVLDKFNALCTDLASGLPAEIEARKKQYEYYRDKLLTFKERIYEY